MATPEPATSQVVAMLAEHKMRLRVLFMRDGHICEAEQAELDNLRDLIMPVADEANLARELMVSFGNVGRITDWQRRKVREFGRDHNTDVIDLDTYRIERDADSTA